MTGQRLFVITALAACALIAGCRQQGSPGAAPATSPATASAPAPSTPPAGSPSAPASPASPAACARLQPGTGPTVRLTNTDNGKTFCLKRGTRFFVFLRGAPARLWTPIQVSSADVAHRASGVMSLMAGETGGYFQAVGDGKATLTSTRGPCRPDSAGQPDFSSTCTARSFFRVTVVISG